MSITQDSEKQRKQEFEEAAADLAVGGMDHDSLQSETFLNLIKYLNPDIKLPSKEELMIMNDEKFENLHHQVLKLVLHSNITVHPSFDTWKGEEFKEAALGVQCSFVDEEFKYKQVLLKIRVSLDAF